MTIRLAIALAAALTCTFTSLAEPPIVLDGAFNDWRDIEPVLHDPADAREAELDLGELRVLHDNEFVYLLLETRRPKNLQGLDGSLQLLLDADGDPATGIEHHGLTGVDVIITCTPPADRPGRRGMGIGLLSTTYEPDPNEPPLLPLSPYDVGFRFAPTYANPYYEMRMRSGAELPNTPAFLSGDRFSGRFVLLDPHGAVSDTTPAWTYELEPRPMTAATKDPANPFERAPGTDLRIVTWNVYHSGILKEPAAARLLAALQPDIVLLQELEDSTTAAQLTNVMRLVEAESAGGRASSTWHAMIGSGGGSLRCGILSRWPLTTPTLLEPIPYPGRDDRHLRAAASIVRADDRRVLVTSLHLKCCGRIGDESDLKRETEATAIRDALSEVMKADGVDAVVVGGDFNLVGGRRPLTIARSGIDVDGSALSIVRALQPDHSTNATWRDQDQPFVPGRLDFVLYADASLALRHAVVVDTRDIDPMLLRQRELRTEDLDDVSDHLPIIADYQWGAE